MSSNRNGPPPATAHDLLASTTPMVPSLSFNAGMVFSMPPPVPGSFPYDLQTSIVPVSAAGVPGPMPIAPPTLNMSSAMTIPAPGTTTMPHMTDLVLVDELGSDKRKKKRSGTQPRKGTDSKQTPHEKRSCVALRPQDDDGTRRRFTELEELYLLKGVQMDLLAAEERGDGKKHRVQWAKILRNKAFKFHPKRISVDLKDKYRNLARKGIKTVAQLLNMYKDQAPALLEKAKRDGVDLSSDATGFSVPTAAAPVPSPVPPLPTSGALSDGMYQSRYSSSFGAKPEPMGTNVPPAPPAPPAPVAPVVPTHLPMARDSLMNVQVVANFSDVIVRRKMRTDLPLSAIFQECKDQWEVGPEVVVYFVVAGTSHVLSPVQAVGYLRDPAKKVLELEASILRP